MEITKICFKIGGSNYEYLIDNQGKVTCATIYNTDRKRIKAVLRGFELVEQVTKKHKDYC